jgi:hypothetical protein
VLRNYTLSPLGLYHDVNTFRIYAFLHAVTMSELQQIKRLVELIQKLSMEFGAVKAELEESRVDVDSIRETLNGLLGVNT